MDAHEFYTQIIGIKNASIVQRLCENSTISSLPKGTLYIRAGDPIKTVPFLLDGVFRGYFLDLNGREITDCIGFKTGFTMMSSFSLNGISYINMEVLEDSTVLCIPSDFLAKILAEYPELLYTYNQLLITSLEYHWKMKSLLCQSTAMDRYKWFLKEYPGLINRISNKYIASFLGITPVTLSRLRRTLRENSSSSKIETD